MPLLSNASRGRRPRRRRRSGGKRLTWVVLLMIGVGGALAWWQFGGDSPETATAQNPRSDDRHQPSDEPDDEPAPPQPTTPQPGGALSEELDPATPEPDTLTLTEQDPAEDRTAQDDEPAEASAQEPDRTSSEQQQASATDSRTREPEQDPGASERTPASADRRSGQDTAQNYAERNVGRNTPYSQDMQDGMRKIASGDYVEGRAILSRILLGGDYRVLPHDARTIRDTLNSVNRELAFAGQSERSDGLIDFYSVSSGQTLGRIGREHDVPHGILERINNMQAHQLQANQTIRVINGPIHARVVKSQYAMDTYVYDQDDNPIFLHSFRVGLGADDSTPTGRWLATPGGKVVNPDWRNPRTGEYYESDDPENPIGGYWIGMTGMDPDNEDQRGYGIHGTIEPESIGQQQSMGCIRLADGDIELAFDMLAGGKSEIVVVE